MDTEYAPEITYPDTTCRTCRTMIQWIACPTGGWWAHAEHPADGHDAEPAADLDSSAAQHEDKRTKLND
ncbi:hypothetical protein [Streptomyces sp. AP-93]|uniref:hypothetical protein n=1 Tax=Streptomyces sp. AP-93 TaxID=2929048 RepID=UPI001FAEF808|nr:hypothetical protein [Streptomyces sp. AP-93]MCJ0875607.1 hypothetical protein [Streptomyces sp. AP-93]